VKKTSNKNHTTRSDLTIFQKQNHKSNLKQFQYLNDFLRFIINISQCSFIQNANLTKKNVCLKSICIKSIILLEQKFCVKISL